MRALPDEGRIHFSTVYATALSEPGTDPVRESAAETAAEIDPALSVITGIADVLRASEPSDRSDTHRTWSERSMVTPEGSSAELWWVRATMARPDGTSDILWSIEGATEASGPFTELGNGRHRPDGSGTIDWDLMTTADVLSLGEGAGAVAIEYAVEPSGERVAEIRVQTGRFGVEKRYTFVGMHLFGWEGAFRITEDGEVHEGLAFVYLNPDGSGRGEGVLFDDGGEQPFVTCWDALGNQVHQDGDGEWIADVGDEAECSVPAFNP